MAIVGSIDSNRPCWVSSLAVVSVMLKMTDHANRVKSEGLGTVSWSIGSLILITGFVHKWQRHAIIKLLLYPFSLKAAAHRLSLCADSGLILADIISYHNHDFQNPELVRISICYLADFNCRRSSSSSCCHGGCLLPYGQTLGVVGDHTCCYFHEKMQVRNVWHDEVYA